MNVTTYAFLRLESCDCSDDLDIEYETLDFRVMSNMNDLFIDGPGTNYP